MKLKAIILGIIITALLSTAVFAGPWNLFGPKIIPGSPVNPSNPGSPAPKNVPAEWSELEEKSLDEDSAGGLLYENLKSKCYDPDNPIMISIDWSSPHFKLALKGANYDLYISDLEQDWAGKSAIVLDCNGADAYLPVTINPVQDAPEVRDVYITASNDPADEDSTLTGHYTFYDVDTPYTGDSEQDRETKWFRNSYEITSLRDSLMVDPSYVHENDAWIFAVRVFDGIDWSEWMYSPEFNIGETQDPDGPDEPDEPSETFSVGDLLVTSLIVRSEYSKAGDTLEISMDLENKGDEKLKDVTVSATIQELATRKNIGPFDLGRNDEISKRIFLEIPEDTPEGTYYIRLTFNNDDMKRIKFREVVII